MVLRKMSSFAPVPVNVLRALGSKLNNNSNFNNKNLMNVNNCYFDLMSEFEESDVDFYSGCDEFNTKCFDRNNNMLLRGDEVVDDEEGMVCSQELVPLSSSPDRRMMAYTGDQIDPTTLRGTLRRNESFDRCYFQPNERKVLVIYTGGTIGMVRSKRGALTCAPNMLENTVRKFPHLHDDEYAKERFAGCVGENGPTPLVLP